MAVQAAQVSVTTSPTPLNTADPDALSVLVRLPAAATASVYVGPSNVTTATGVELPAGAAITVDLGGDVLYGIVASGTQTVHVLRLGVG